MSVQGRKPKNSKFYDIWEYWRLAGEYPFRNPYEIATNTTAVVPRGRSERVSMTTECDLESSTTMPADKKWRCDFLLVVYSNPFCDSNFYEYITCLANVHDCLFKKTLNSTLNGLDHLKS